ncbi:MAG: DUF1223 domain-containing protein [Caulobacteraceae bacterium]|nr:DUF1223 domain-containing protein [Caulobacteraceae bacterium]
MRPAVFPTSLFAALALVAAVAASPPAMAKAPVVVELYTAQGCSACIKANEAVDALADRSGVLPLTFSVDYWDYLGWKDTFAAPEFSERQRAYAKKLALRDVYTPQVIVDGRFQTAGGHPERVDKLIKDAAKAAADPPDMAFTRAGARIAVGSGPSPKGGAEVWLIRYDPHEQQVEVKRGENRGKTVVHRNVVRQLVKLGPWAGRPRTYAVPEADDDGLAAVVVVQAVKTGRILALKQAKPAKPAKPAT